MAPTEMTMPAETVKTMALDKLGCLLAPLILGCAVFLPFAQFSANRIVEGEGVALLTALPAPYGWLLMAMAVAASLLTVFRTAVSIRLSIGLAGIVVLSLFIGIAASALVPPEDTVARVSPGSGFWGLFACCALLATDALARMAPPPIVRIGLVAMAGAALAAFLISGIWSDLSVMREYANRAESFWREGGRHLFLAFGSLAAATAVGIPLGILCHQSRGVRGPTLAVLNILQTVPSIALFGLLIAPLSWLSTAVPFLREIGISGIGAAPAFIALFFYSLLPIVANTAVGLAGVPAAVTEAASGMGMTPRQRLVSIKLPLAFPVILAGIRIVLVQNIGLATIAALIGGGGFGVFVFQGVGQTAMDLVLLGALPTVTLAFAAAIILDAAVDMAKPSATREIAR